MEFLFSITRFPDKYSKPDFEAFITTMNHRNQVRFYDRLGRSLDAQTGVEGTHFYSSKMRSAFKPIFSVPPDTRLRFFEALQAHGLDERFQEVCRQPQSYIPMDFKQHFLKWLKHHPAPAAPAGAMPDETVAPQAEEPVTLTFDPPAEEIPVPILESQESTVEAAHENAEEPPRPREISYVEIEGIEIATGNHDATETAEDPAIVSTYTGDDGIQIVEVNHPLVVTGEQDHIQPLEESETGQNHDEPKPQPRRQWLLGYLQENGIQPDDIIVYTEKTRSDRTNNYPYEIVEFQNKGVHAQIALCNFTRFGTYVVKNPVDIGPETIVRLSDLKDDPNVFKTILKTREQWLAQIYQFLYTETQNLPAQVKHNLSWRDKKQALEETLMAEIVRTGAMPFSGDNTPMQHGPLAGRSSWRRASSALHRQHIAGLEGAGNLAELYEHVRADHPELNSFLHASPIEAADVYRDSVRMVREYNAVPQTALFDDMEELEITIAGRHIKAVDMAFHFEAVRGSSAHSVDEYVQRAGIGEPGSDGTLKPVTYDL